MSRPNVPFPPEPWPSVRDRLAAALAADPVTAGRTVTFQDKGEVWTRAYQALGMVQGAYDWDTVAGRMIVAETTAMVRPFFHAPDSAPIAFTSGGTESNLLALKAARDWARAVRPGARRPEILMTRATHVCHTKAAQLLGLAERRVATGPEGCADPAVLEAAVRPDTVAIVASYPTDTHGRCDDVPALAALAARHGLWCHVDASFGGYIAPFLKEIGETLPDFDFRVSGVRSIAADLHKLGYAPTGISTLVLREASDEPHLRFRFGDWDGPAMDSDRIAGTRSFDVLAGAWATLRQLGWDGLRERARRLRDNTRLLAARLERIPGLELLARPEIGIIHFRVAGAGAAALGAALRASGHRPYVTTNPAGIVVCAGPDLPETTLDAYARDVAAAATPTG